jgi:hypothetical protein
VPAGASLATVDAVLSHASERRQIQQIDPHTTGRDQYVLVNVTDLTCCGSTGNGTYVVLSQVLHTELALVTPVYYDDGWLLGERPGSGQRVSNGTLTPMRPGTAHKVRRYTLTWDASLGTAFSQWFTCVPKWRAGDPAAAACFAVPNARFQSWQDLLAGLLARVLPSLRGGCADLGRTSLYATQRLSRDVNQLAPSARSQDRKALPNALGLVSNDLTSRDLSGPLDRLVVLCTPRS